MLDGKVLKLLLIIITLFAFVVLETKSMVYHGRYNIYGQQSQPGAVVPSKQSKEYLDSKSGFSTFGIISMLFVIILCCLIFYYGIMCFPILCKSEKKYQFMNVSSTITAATSRSIQSIESLDQKH